MELKVNFTKVGDNDFEFAGIVANGELPEYVAIKDVEDYATVVFSYKSVMEYVMFIKGHSYSFEEAEAKIREIESLSDKYKDLKEVTFTVAL